MQNVAAGLKALCFPNCVQIQFWFLVIVPSVRLS